MKQWAETEIKLDEPINPFDQDEELRRFKEARRVVWYYGGIGNAATPFPRPRLGGPLLQNSNSIKRTKIVQQNGTRERGAWLRKRTIQRNKRGYSKREVSNKNGDIARTRGIEKEAERERGRKGANRERRIEISDLVSGHYW